MHAIAFNRKWAFVASSYIASLSLVLALSGSCDSAGSQGELRFEGTRLVRDTVEPHATDVWTVRLRAYRSAQITIQADRGVPLECVLTDPRDQLIGQRGAVASRCQITVTPAQTGAHRLEVTNPGDLPRGYSVLLR